MYLGLCIDGLNPFELFVAPYSCWSMILIVYNLPLGMCMRLELIFFYLRLYLVLIIQVGI
jgi:hypothetical protein